jgi:hypothetical protein
VETCHVALKFQLPLAADLYILVLAPQSADAGRASAAFTGSATSASITIINADEIFRNNWFFIVFSLVEQICKDGGRVSLARCDQNDPVTLIKEEQQAIKLKTKPGTCGRFRYWLPKD